MTDSRHLGLPEDATLAVRAPADRRARAVVGGSFRQRMRETKLTQALVSPGRDLRAHLFGRHEWVTRGELQWRVRGHRKAAAVNCPASVDVPWADGSGLVWLFASAGTMWSGRRASSRFLLPPWCFCWREPWASFCRPQGRDSPSAPTSPSPRGTPLSWYASIAHRISPTVEC